MADVRSASKLTVGFKFIALLAVLLVSAVTLLAGLSVWLFEQDNTSLVKQLNLHEASGLAASVRETFEGLVPKSETFASLLSQEGDTKPELDQAFARYPEFLGVALTSNSPNTLRSALAPVLIAEGGNDASEWVSRAFPKLPDFSSTSAEPVVAWASIGLHRSAITLAIPYNTKSGERATLLAFLEPKRISETFSRTDGVTAYLVDAAGALLAHSDHPVTSQETSKLPGIKDFLGGKQANQEFRYTDAASQEVRMAAFIQVGFGKLGVVSEVPESVALEASRRVVKLAVLVALLILCASMFVGSIYSGLLVSPILGLTHATQRIADGKLETRVEVPAKGGDEIAQLGRAFNSMAQGLEEREKYRDTFVKFHSKEVADKILSGDLKLGGQKLEAIILFVDIRGFTKLSESLAPEVVVEFLNQYMSRMVRIIRSHGGVIDKFIGDAILATWGVPYPDADDAQNAVAACLAIRAELERFNESRAKQWKEPLRIGMGLNRGPVIAGNIGSEERMEYTVIGDAVNVASRLESMTKEMGVDLLISNSVRDVVQGRFGFTEGPKIQVRGRSEEVQVYLVPGRSGQVEKAAS